MSVEAVAAPVVPRASAEEAARGDFYALLARMLHGAPDMRSLRPGRRPAIPADGSPTSPARGDLVDASSAMDAVASRFERSSSAWSEAAVSSIHRVLRRRAIHRPSAGASRRTSRPGPRTPRRSPNQDHCGLLDVMRVLVLGGGPLPGRGASKAFFLDHLKRGSPRFSALGRSPHANYSGGIRTAFTAGMESFRWNDAAHANRRRTMKTMKIHHHHFLLPGWAPPRCPAVMTAGKTPPPRPK
jgi:hypothetical protein